MGLSLNMYGIELEYVWSLKQQAHKLVVVLEKAMREIEFLNKEREKRKIYVDNPNLEQDSQDYKEAEKFYEKIFKV